MDGENDGTWFFPYFWKHPYGGFSGFATRVKTRSYINEGAFEAGG